MASATDPLPLTEIHAPLDQAELAGFVRGHFETETVMYPLGGQTSLGFGLVPRQSGVGISLHGLSRVVDYPARDMTITVEAGITMEALSRQLASERQRLPIDVAQSSRATLGGVVAMNASGPRRYGCGTIRDYVIGIGAVDGRGTSFKGGGRVVKNVAGYDFCKLLTGSLGLLGIITQLTLKVTPLPEASAFVACDVSNLQQAEALLAALVTSRTTPAAIELLLGPAWLDDPALGPMPESAACRLAVGLEGTSPEVDWMVDQLMGEWKEQGVTSARPVVGEQAASLWHRLAEFAADDGQSALMLKAMVRPSNLNSLLALLVDHASRPSIQLHAGNGVVLAKFPTFSATDVSKFLIRAVQPATQAAGGHCTVWASKVPSEMTRQAVWGPARSDVELLRAVKNQFDPRGLFNPGRFMVG